MTHTKTPARDVARCESELIIEHAEATRLIAAINARLDECDPETPSWDDVASMRYMNERMREMLGEVG